MHTLQYRLIFCILIFFSASCADYKLHIAPEAKDWAEKTPDPNLKITHSMYLIGDAGNSPLGGTKPALKLLKSHLDTASENSSVIFLGDNIYPVGMPKKSEDYREVAEHRLNAQIETTRNFAGRPIFLPGNHDWGKYGVEGVRREEKYVEKELEKIYDDKFKSKEFFLPNNGCSGPEVIELSDQLVVIVIDSQWWLADWDKQPDINDDCDIKDREVFKFLFNDIVRKYRSKNCVIAMHHPIYNNGTHGGHYTWKQHLFPLTEKSDHLWIPFPIIGSIAQFARATTGMRQDNANGIYKQMIDAVATPAKKSGEYIFAAGHEHSLQYFEQDGQKFIVSGAGSKETPTVAGNGSLMTYGHYGFSKIDFYEDGSAWLEFYVPIDDGTEGRTIFRHKIKDKLDISPENIPDDFPNYKNGKDTVSSKAITTETKEVGGFHNALLGEHWREIYRKDYDFPVLDLAEFQGGVTVLKRGGGNQTNSLRLEDKKGRQYAMRALTKDASRFIPYPFNQLDATNFLVKDNFLSTHPFTPLAIPKMGDAANIYHTNPKLYYVPKQPVLDVHNDVFGDEVYLVEERPMEEWEDQETFGTPDDIISTYDVAEKIKKGHKHRVDQKWAVRTRLFDMLVGDWDRHDDQWRWSKIKEDGINLYRPIPRDRDQAFSKYDGIITAIARLYAPFLRQLVTYKPELGSMKWASWSPRHFDAAFLNELSLEEWLEQAKYIQDNVTDEIIEEAFREMPADAYDLSADELIPILKQRRANLQDFAHDLYIYLAEKVTVTGSEKDDYFEIIREDDEHTTVYIYDRSKKGGKDEKMYKRTFKRSETKEIFLYGLNGDDFFIVKGDVKKSIKVNLIGGLDEDEFQDESRVSSLGRKTIVYDNLEGNEVTGGKETKDRRSIEAEENTYVRRGPQYERNIVTPSPVLAVNPDDGFLAGFGLQFSNFAFGKPHFSEKHSFTADYAFATKGLNLEYKGVYFDVLKRWDFVTNLRGTNSRHSINFFGLGNESEYIPEIDDDLNYNRVRQGNIYLDFGLQRRFGGNLGAISFRPLIDITKIEETSNRFISSDATGLPSDIFERQYNGGGIFSLDFKNTDSNSAPTSGTDFHFDYTVQTNLKTPDQLFNRLSTYWTMYFPLTAKKNAVFASRVGFAKIGGEYSFFQAPTLGGNGGVSGINNLRGHRAQRFRGDATFYHNLDLRLKLFTSKNSILPFSLGLHGGFDYGRIWSNGEESDKWRTGYGGGLWVAPIDFVVISFASYWSEKDRRFILGVGQAF
ncbi:MAG: hypothetical protein ACI85O_003161 [Saprospiraceae bacterium]|jgi:hypothetical protein